MANNTDLVKEIGYRLKDLERVRQLHYNTIGGAETVIACEKAELTLQRARDAIIKAQGELVQLSESTDSMGHPVFARQLMDIHDILSAYTPEEK